MPEGFFSGVEEGMQAEQAHEMGQIKIQAGQIGVEQEKVALRQSQLLLQGQERMAKAMAQMNNKQNPMADLGDQTSQIAGQLNSFGEMYLASGMPEQATKMFDTASKMQKNHMQLLEAESKRQTEDMQLVSNLMGNVHDQKSWQEAATLFIMERPQSVSAYNGLIQKIASGEVPYNPHTAEVLKDAAQKNIDKVREDLDRARQAEANAATAEKGHNIRLIDERLEVEKDRDANLKKEGDIKHKPVSASLIARAVDEASSEYDVQDNAPDARRRALPIAERARDLMMDHPDMSESDAIRRAYQEGKAGFEGLKTKPHAESPGGAKDRALTRPEPDGSLRPNTWYHTKQGVKKTDGSGHFTD